MMVRLSHLCAFKGCFLGRDAAAGLKNMHKLPALLPILLLAFLFSARRRLTTDRPPALRWLCVYVCVCGGGGRGRA